MRTRPKIKILIIAFFAILFYFPTTALAGFAIGDTCAASVECAPNACNSITNQCTDPYFTQFKAGSALFCCIGKDMISCINNTNNPEECMINAQCLSGYCKDFSKQSFDNTCAKYNLEGCSNATDCNKEGHIWNQADKNCTTKNFCQSANGIVVNSTLYGKICTSKNLPQCAPNIITDCVYYEVINDSTCTTNGMFGASY